jgi:hypothetical protein
MKGGEGERQERKEGRKEGKGRNENHYSLCALCHIQDAGRYLSHPVLPLVHQE